MNEKTQHRRIYGATSLLRRRSSASSSSSLHSNSTISDAAVFSQRIVSVDCYTSSYPITGLDPLISEFRGTEVKKVPVIRIYGATPRGQKTCTHVHGVFPYIYVENTSSDDDFEYMLALALDNAINSMFNYSSANNPNERVVQQHVFKIVRVRGRSFYGYKSSGRSFLQIFFYSPISLKKGVELLESGKILRQRFQPYETHIPYILQFFLDYKLYGMNFIHFRDIKFRRKDSVLCASSQLLSKTPTTTGSGSKTYWDLDTMPEELLLHPKITPRCRLELEIDVKASDILVSDSLMGKNPGIVDIWLDEKERRRQHCVPDWANITIPQSPGRSHETDFIFPREAELLQLLGEHLEGTLDSSSLMESSQSQSSQEEFLPNTQISSSKLDTFPSPVSFQSSQSRRSSSFHSQSNDEEIIDLLEGMADAIEEDSILPCSQSQRLSPVVSTLVGSQREDRVRVGEISSDDNEDYALEDEWAEDFLSQSTIDLLDKWEQERINQGQQPEEGSHTSGDRDFHQCDGQVDDSDSDDDEEGQSGSSSKRRKLNVPAWRRVYKVKVKPKPLSRQKPAGQSSTSSAPRTLTEFKNRVLSQSKIDSDSGSDSDCQIISVVNKSKAETPTPSVRSKQLRSISIEEVESDTESKKTKKKPELGEKSVSTASRLKAKVTGQLHTENEQSRSKKKTKVVSKDRASQEEHGDDNDKDSGITSYNPKPPDETHEEQKGSSESSSSQEILPASPAPIKVSSHTKRRSVSRASASTPVTPVSKLSKSAVNSPATPESESLITSIYNYGDESMFNEEEEEVEPSQSDSIVSFYEYSIPNDDKFNSQASQSQSGDKSFENSQLEPDHSPLNKGTTSSKNNEQEDESSSYDEDEPISEFQRKKCMHNMLRKNRREQALAKINSTRPSPSIFQNEIRPLKRTPLTKCINKWCLEKEKPDNVTICQNDDPASLQYIRGTTNGDGPRNKLIGDILKLAKVMAKNQDKTGQDERTIEETANPIPLPPSAAGNTETHKSPPEQAVSSSSDDESDEDEENQRPVKAFRFRGGGGPQKDSGSSSDDDSDENDNDTMIASPVSACSSLSQAPSPAISSQGSNNSKTATPKSILKKSSTLLGKKRLEFSPAEDKTNRSRNEEWPKFRPEDSELDTVLSPNCSTTPKAGRGQDLNSSNMKQAKASHEHQFLTSFAVEVLCSTRGDLIPDPEHDSVLAIFYAIYHDSPDNTSGNFITGSLCVDASPHPASESGVNTENNEEMFPNEISMIKRFITLVHSYDPDILVGYEIEKFSWGYIIQRGSQLDMNIQSELSRILPLPTSDKYQNRREHEQWNETIHGRIVFNLWKLLRHELAVTSYTYENMVLKILHEKNHRLSYKVLDNYWHTAEKRSNVKLYFQTRVVNCMKIIDKLDLINRTSELARLFGIQFFEVLSRGSQFRVESMMLRLVKPERFIPPSPNPMQRAKMKAPEYLPLILEPESKFYTDPVAVLDFQSLYPSMMIAYNYCFSTCIGRLDNLGEETFELGCLQQEIKKSELAKLYKKGLLHISPCRVVFVKPTVRKGILSTMLEQILDTRQMVKRSMKKWKDNETLQKVLDSRQLGLKLIANVTYGYTSANWSGRMPCVEIADSIVSKGRETLQRAIDYVKENENIFGGKVIYGDTDSLFVLFPGKSRQEAFTLAQQIVDDVTQANPKPVKLKLEKIYQPCILQTKKRYVGFAYETPDQKEPKYDAKGIETVRRDGCPATAKILEGAIRVLFTKKDEEPVKDYVTEQFRKIFLGRVSLSNYTFARKFRGRNGYKPSARVPSLEIAKKLAEKDRRAEPLPKERVPYIVTYGNPWAPLIERVRRPEEFINDPNLRLNAHYYIEKAIIPALNRCLNLAGFHADKWFLQMPRKYLKSDYVDGGQQKKGTIDQYFVSQKCIKCESRAANGYCENCFKTPASLKAFLAKQTHTLSSKYETCLKICQDCSKETQMICMNMDCPVKHKYLRYERDYRAKLPKIQELQNRLAVLDW